MRPDAVATSLIDATKTICVPYVVDGVAIDKLVDRTGISRRVDHFHGVEIVRYRVDAPGDPVVTPAPARDFGQGPDGRRVQTYRSCWIEVDGPSTEFARQVYREYRDRLVLRPRQTKASHEMPGTLRVNPPPRLDVVCVLGDTPALISTDNPDWGSANAMPRPLANLVKGKVEIDIDSHEPSEGCP